MNTTNRQSIGDKELVSGRASTVSSAFTITKVHEAHRMGVGTIFTGVIPILDLFHLMDRNLIMYSPKYQRGFNARSAKNKTEADYDKCLSIFDSDVNIETGRSNEIAMRYLLGCTPEQPKQLFDYQIIWNARKEKGHTCEPLQPETCRQLVLDGDELTIDARIVVPDSAHRHRAYYALGSWYENPEPGGPIPNSIDVDGDIWDGETIGKMVKDCLHLDETDLHTARVDIFHLTGVEEGRLWDQINSDARKASKSVEIDMDYERNAERRFVKAIMNQSEMFSADEIEKRATTITRNSRKLTTNSTLVTAVEPYKAILQKLEDESPPDHQDLVDFFIAFFDEWANHFPAMAPGAKTEDRVVMRGQSMAGANVMYFPLIELLFKIWDIYNDNGDAWIGKSEWKNVLARLAGHIDEKDANSFLIMDRDNTDWDGRVFITTTRMKKRPDGSEYPDTKRSISSTRDTRASAFAYLEGICADLLPKRK